MYLAEKKDLFVSLFLYDFKLYLNSQNEEFAEKKKKKLLEGTNYHLLKRRKR